MVHLLQMQIRIFAYQFMMNSTPLPSKIKVGRLWGYPIIVTTGKSKHEAILLDCNDDNPQLFLQRNVNVKIRWKVAGYNDNVPASNVKLQDDTDYYRPRRAVATAADLQHDEPSVSKKRKINRKVDIGDEDKKPSAVTSGVHVKKEEEVETDNDDEEMIKPDTISSNGAVHIKSEDIETDSDSEMKPSAVTSGINVKEEVETDDDQEMKPDAVSSSSAINVKTEEVETDDEDDGKIQPDVTTSMGTAIKTEEVETDDDAEDDEKKPQAVTSSDVAVKTEEVETDDDRGEEDDEFIHDGCLRIPKVDCTNESFFRYNSSLTVRELICWALRTENKVRLAKIERRLGSTTEEKYSYSKTLDSNYLIDIYPETASSPTTLKHDLTAEAREKYKFSRKVLPQLNSKLIGKDLFAGLTSIDIEKKKDTDGNRKRIIDDSSSSEDEDGGDVNGQQRVPPTLLHFEIILESYMGYSLSSEDSKDGGNGHPSFYHHPETTLPRAAIMGGSVVTALNAYQDKEVVKLFDNSGLFNKDGSLEMGTEYWGRLAKLMKSLHCHFNTKRQDGDVDVFLQASPLTQGIVHSLRERGIKDQLIKHIGSYVGNAGLCDGDLVNYTTKAMDYITVASENDEARFIYTVSKRAVSFIVGGGEDYYWLVDENIWPRTSQFIMLNAQADLLGGLLDFDISAAACSYDGISVRVAPRATLSFMTNALFITPFCLEEHRNKRRVLKYASRGFKPFLVDPHDNSPSQNVACDAQILHNRPFQEYKNKSYGKSGYWFGNHRRVRRTDQDDDISIRPYEDDKERILAIQKEKGVLWKDRDQHLVLCCHNVGARDDGGGRGLQKYTQKMFEVSEGDAIDYFSKRFEWTAEDRRMVNEVDPNLRMSCTRCKHEYLVVRVISKKYPALMKEYDIDIEDGNFRGDFSYAHSGDMIPTGSSIESCFYSGNVFDNSRRSDHKIWGMLRAQSFFEVCSHVLKHGTPDGYIKRFEYGDRWSLRNLQVPLREPTRQPIGLNPERFMEKCIGCKKWLIGERYGTEICEDCGRAFSK